MSCVCDVRWIVDNICCLIKPGAVVVTQRLERLKRERLHDL